MDTDAHGLAGAPQGSGLPRQSTNVMCVSVLKGLHDPACALVNPDRAANREARLVGRTIGRASGNLAEYLASAREV